MDIFGTGANSAAKKKDVELFDGKPVTMENNALVRLLKEERERMIEDATLRMKWEDHIESTLGQTAALCGTIGRRPKGVRYDGTNIWIELRGEAVKLPVGAIRDPKDLAVACQKLIGAVMMV